MTIILPKDGYTLQDVDMGRAYQEFKEKSAKTAVACQVPYFSLDSVNNLTEKTATLIQGRLRSLEARHDCPRAFLSLLLPKQSLRIL
jgi:hypothetical protein